MSFEGEGFVENHAEDFVGKHVEVSCHSMLVYARTFLPAGYIEHHSSFPQIIKTTTMSV